MNTKSTAPLLVTLAPFATAIAPAIPALLVGGAALLVLNWLLSDNDKKKQSATLPANKAEIPRKIAETPIIRQIPATIPAMPAAVPRPPVPPVVVPPPAIPAAPKVSAPVSVPAAVIVPKVAAQAPPPSPISPIKKKVVTREDMATVFQCGTRPLNRTAAVAALKSLGFGKTAAYAALTPGGRFAPWLKIAPDGIITWTDGHKV